MPSHVFQRSSQSKLHLSKMACETNDHNRSTFSTDFKTGSLLILQHGINDTQRLSQNFAQISTIPLVSFFQESFDMLAQEVMFGFDTLAQEVMFGLS
jgi:hypothetical protein